MHSSLSTAKSFCFEQRTSITGSFVFNPIQLNPFAGKTASSLPSLTIPIFLMITGRFLQYRNMERATSDLPENGFKPYSNQTEAVKRSPVFMDTPVSQREKSKLVIYAGIHDGCLGGDASFTRSLKMFNKIVSDFDYSDKEKLFSAEEMLCLMDWQTTEVLVLRENLSIAGMGEYNY